MKRTVYDYPALLENRPMSCFVTMRCRNKGTLSRHPPRIPCQVFYLDGLINHGPIVPLVISHAHNQGDPIGFPIIYNLMLDSVVKKPTLPSLHDYLLI